MAVGIGVAGFEGCASGILDKAGREQILHPAQVPLAPTAARSSRRETNPVARFVDALPDSVDPPEAQRDIHGFRPGDAPAARALLEIADPLFGEAGVVLPKPSPHCVGVGKESDCHGRIQELRTRIRAARLATGPPAESECAAWLLRLAGLGPDLVQEFRHQVVEPRRLWAVLGG